MVGRYQKNAFIAESIFQPRQKIVELLKPLVISRDISAMSPEHIEIDQIREHESFGSRRPVDGFADGFKRSRHSVAVVARANGFVDAFTVEYVVYFSDGRHSHAGFPEFVKKRLAGGVEGVIVTVRRARKRPRLADKRPRDNAAHVMRRHQHFSGGFAYFVKFFEPENFGILVRGHLKNAVGRSVYYRISGFVMLVAELF